MYGAPGFVALHPHFKTEMWGTRLCYCGGGWVGWGWGCLSLSLSPPPPKIFWKMFFFFWGAGSGGVGGVAVGWSVGWALAVLMGLAGGWRVVAGVESICGRQCRRSSG